MVYKESRERTTGGGAPGHTPALFRRGLVPAAIALLGTALAVVPASVAQAGTVRVGRAPSVDPAFSALGALDPASTLQAEVALTPQDPAALQAYASAVATPGSPDYHQYLTTAQFAARFGAPAGAAAAVQQALDAVGLTAGTPAPDGLFVPVSGQVSTFERALSLSFDRYRGPKGRTFFANTAAPAVPRAIASAVRGIVGLDNLSVPVSSASSAAVQPQTGGPVPCSSASSGFSNMMTSTKLSQAYGLNSVYGTGDLGQGVTIALYELEPYSSSASDTATFKSCYGVSTSVNYEQVDGGPIGSQGGLETQLDIDNVVELAPDANVVVYQGPNNFTDATANGPFDTYKQIIDDNTAQVISTSWGACEYDMGYSGSTGAQAENTLFAQAATQGQTILAAAGDQGSEGCDYSGTNDPNPTTDLQVLDPAAQPNVTGVGGTTLTNVATSPPTESAWNDGGGGISTFWAMPSYQSSAPAGLNVENSHSSGSPCGASSGYCREVPDVSADADPSTGYVVYESADFGWESVGGTSGAAPLWAAIVALADAHTTCSPAAVGFANPDLYAIAATSSYSSAFNDVTTGNNDATSQNVGLYPAGSKYDMVTGLGTPEAAALVPLLGSPCIASVSPDAAIAGSTVTVTGEHLTGVTSMSFGSAPVNMASVVVNSSGTSMTLQVPPASPGQTVDITATTARGTSAVVTGDRFAYGVPTLTAVAPEGGSSGTSVTLSGSGLYTVTAIHFGAASAALSVASDSTITATVPVGTPGSTVAITATNVYGTSVASGGANFTYAPTVSSVSPGSGANGTGVTITGSGFAGASSVAFGSASTSFTRLSDTQISASAPTGPAGTVDVTVSNPLGTSATSSLDQFTYPAVISSLSTQNGPTSGGTTVIISGSGFSSVPATGAISFGGTAATSYMILSDTTISAVAPSAAAGTVTVTVANAAGNSADGGGAQFTFQAPVVTTPSSVVTTPSSVVIATPPVTAPVTLPRVVRIGPVSARRSTLAVNARSVAANGHAHAAVKVTLFDAAGNEVSGKRVVLTALGGKSVIAPAASTTSRSGVATFSVSDRHAESVTYRATDTKKHLTLTARVTVTFGAMPSASRSGVALSAAVKTSCPTGAGSGRLTVTVRSAAGQNLPGRLVVLSASAGSKATVKPASGVSNGRGGVAFVVSDRSRRAVSFTARDPADGTALGKALAVSFPAPRRC